MSDKIFTDRLHKVLFGFKMGLSASVFHCKNNSKKYGDLSLQKVLKISPNLRLSILINLVLIKEEYSTPRKIIFLVLSLYWNNVIRIYIGTMPKIIFTFVSSIFWYYMVCNYFSIIIICWKFKSSWTKPPACEVGGLLQISWGLFSVLGLYCVCESVTFLVIHIYEPSQAFMSLCKPLFLLNKALNLQSRHRVFSIFLVNKSANYGRISNVHNLLLYLVL